MGGERWERLGLQALATLPLWVAAALVAVFAHDLTEVAAAVVAGAGLVSLAGLVALLTLSRRVSDAGDRQEQVVVQSLALVECMKDINRRVAGIEAARIVSVAHVRDAETPLAVVATLALPAAGNDPEPGEHGEPETPDNAFVRLPVRNLGDGVTVGVVLRFADGAAQDGAGLAGLLREAGRGPADRAVEIVAPLTLACSAEGADMLAEYLARGLPPLLLSVEQASLRDARREDARELTRLTRLGLGLSLCGLSGIDAKPAALKACAVERVRIDRPALLTVARENPQGLMRWCEELAQGGVMLVADGVEQGRDAAIVAALGVAFGLSEDRPHEDGICQQDGAPARARPPMPWRAERARRAAAI